MLTPTRRFVTVELDLRLRSLGSANLPLAEALVVTDDGQWSIAVEEIQAVLPDRTVDEPLNERAQSVLIAMLELGALDSDHRQPTEKIAIKALGVGTDPNALKAVMADLKTRRLIDSKKGSGGGYWLNEAGKRRAERLGRF
jgi:hypothetical protein